MRIALFLTCVSMLGLSSAQNQSNVDPLVYCSGCNAVKSSYCYVYDMGSCPSVSALQSDPCGDGVCSGTEDCYSCAVDCGLCTITPPVWEYCGDFVCNNGEIYESCPNDCVSTQDNLAAYTNPENAQMVIGSISAGVIVVLIIGISAGVFLYKAHKAKKAKKTKKDTDIEQKPDTDSTAQNIENPILKTHSVYRSSLTRIPNSVHHKKSFAPQLASVTPNVTGASRSIAQTIIKNPSSAFVEQYDLSSFNAVQARQHVRKIRRPTVAGARLAEQINTLSV